MKSGPSSSSSIPAIPRKPDGRLDFTELSKFFFKLPREAQNRLIAKMTTQDKIDFKAGALAAKKEKLEAIRRDDEEIRRDDEEIRQHQQNVAKLTAKNAQNQALLTQYGSAYVQDMVPKLQELSVSSQKRVSPKLR